MGRWSLGLLLYAALLAACDSAPAPAVDAGNGGEDAGADAGQVDDDGGAADGAVDGDAGAGGDAAGRDTGMVIVDECSPLDQSGCDPQDEKCVIEGGAPGAECAPTSPNDVGFGDPCTGADCQAGLVCLRDAVTSTESHCRQACDLDTNMGCDALPGEYECRTSITMSNWGACTLLPPTCDHYTQAPCEPDEACQPYLRRTGAWEFRCRTAGMAGEGMPCGANNRCERGLACVNENGMAACKRYCMADDDCTSPLTCTGTVAEPPFNFCDD
jgi:hypothetical protein